MFEDDGATGPSEQSRDLAPVPAADPGARTSSLSALLAELDRVVDAITTLDPDGLDGPAAAEASLRVHRAGDRLRAMQLGWLAAAEDARVWLGTGARSFRTWVARTHDVSFAEAGRWVRPARVWREVTPTTALAARLGRTSTAKAALIAATATTPQRVDVLRSPVTDADDAASRTSTEGTQADLGEDGSLLADGAEAGAVAPTRTGEEILLGLAAGYHVDQFAKITRRFSHVADPDADERGFREALAREHLDLARTTGGYHVSGFLTLEHGQIVKTALRAVTGTPSADDTRTAGQRRAAALTSLGRLVLDKGLTGKVGGVRPHLAVHVTFTELENLVRRTGQAAEGATLPRGVGLDLASLVSAPPAEWEDGTGPVPEHVLRRIAADCEITRVVFGPDSQVIDVGRTSRTFTGHLRRAVVARDRACVIDGCDAPPSIGQIHHAVTRWADGGTTSTENAALVCAFHNQWLEDYRVPMRWVADPIEGGRWEAGAPGTYRPPRPGPRRSTPAREPRSRPRASGEDDGAIEPP